MRKVHLQHTIHYGPTCQSGRSGGSLRGEHITEKFSKFAGEPTEQRCTRCAKLTKGCESLPSRMEEFEALPPLAA